MTDRETDFAAWAMRQIAMSRPRPTDLTARQSAYWDRLSADVAEAKAAGLIVDYDIPASYDVDDGK